MRFRKKPVVIEAQQMPHKTDFSSRAEFDDAVFELADWCGGRVGAFGICLHIDTLEGTMTADEGDWIIKGVQGEFYPCKPAIFESTYEKED